MLGLLQWIPIGAAFALGLAYTFTGEGGRGRKILIWVVFGAAAWLQFATRFALFGLLLQAALAMCLAIWWKLESAE